MKTLTSEQLSSRTCAACEGGLEKLTPSEANQLLRSLEGWELRDDGRAIRKRWRLKNFLACVGTLVQVAQLAEREGHHPDLHLEGYHNFRVDLWTHAVGGLSENDFILAAKIDKIVQREE